MLAADLDGWGRWIEERDVRHDVERGGVEHGKVGGETIQDIEPLARFIEGEAAGTFAHFNRPRTDALTICIDDHEVPRSHAGHVTARARAVPRDAARITEG
jgi:hypothetical protein